ncbi:25252_t:CDS:1, partial [Dentiscutata erythropus]
KRKGRKGETEGKGKCVGWREKEREWESECMSEGGERGVGREEGEKSEGVKERSLKSIESKK